MAAPRKTRGEGQRRALMLRTLDLFEVRGWEALALEFLARESGVPVRSLAEALREVGLLEALLAYARHLEEDRDLWLRRFAAQRSEARLRSRAAELDADYLACFAAHFRHWGAAGAAGERSAEFEAAALLGALRRAEALWLEGRGRPQLPVLVHEALVLLWPALYPHQKRNR